MTHQEGDRTVFQTSVQEERKVDIWSVAGAVATFTILTFGSYLLLIR
jgi:hypothetical protein